MRHLNLIIFIMLLGCTVTSGSPIASTSNLSMIPNSPTSSIISKLWSLTCQILESSIFSFFVCFIFIALISQLIFYVNSGKEPFKVYIHLIFSICFFFNCVKGIFYQFLEIFLDYFDISADLCKVISFILIILHLIAFIVDTTYDCLKKNRNHSRERRLYEVI